MNKERIELYLKIRATRASLEEKVKECKAAEQQLKGEILSQLDLMGLDSAKEAGVTISKTRTVRVEVADQAALQLNMYDRMIKAQQEGRPLQDGMLYQRTASKTAVIADIKNTLGIPETDDLNIEDEAVKQAAAALGVRLVTVTDLSVRKA